MLIEINDLETRRFGITCAKRINMEAALADVNAAARALDVKMISTRVDVSDLSQVHQLEADGYRLMDTLIYYRRDLERDWEELATTHGCILRPAQRQDAPAAGEVARAAFSGFFGHYHADPNLRSEDADAAYVDWAKNSMVPATDQAMALVATDKDQVVGFLTLRRNSATRFEVVLNAVHPTHQRCGIYTSLLSRGFSLAQEQGSSEMMISTQINNYPVQKVWGRLGMAPEQGYYTFHKWFD